MMKKIFLISLLLSGIILSGCSSNQSDLLQKQNYLLQQQLNQQIEQQKTDKEKTDLALQEKQNFENNLKCQERGDALKLQYNNVFSAYYNKTAGTCYVKFYDNNQLLTEGPIEDFGATLTISKIQLQQSIKLYGGVTYQEVINTLNSFQQPALKGLIIKLLLAGNIKDIQIIIGMTEGNKTPIESRADGYFGQYTLSHLKEAANRPTK